MQEDSIFIIEHLQSLKFPETRVRESRPDAKKRFIKNTWLDCRKED